MGQAHPAIERMAGATALSTGTSNSPHGNASEMPCQASSHSDRPAWFPMMTPTSVLTQLLDQGELAQHVRGLLQNSYRHLY